MLSIIIPTHNRLYMLKELLESIKKQSYKDIEVIIISDNCTDGTNEYLRTAEFPGAWKFVINEQPLNAGKSRRRGFLLSKGEYVAFVDDDDYFTDNDYYKRAIELFELHLDLSVVAACSINKFEDSGAFEKKKVNIKGYINGMFYMSGFQFKWYKPNPSFAVFRRTKLEDAGIEHMYMVNDCPIYMRVLLFGDIYIEEKTVGVYRIHNNNISKSINADFIIENLDEKNYIYNQLKQRKADFSLSYWWFKTVELTFNYFLSSNPIKSEFDKVLKWCYRHTHISLKLIKYIIKVSISYRRKYYKIPY